MPLYRKILGVSAAAALNDLQARFPNDELINEAVHLNSNTE